MTLEQEMAQLLAEMALLQHGSTTSWNPSGTGKAESRPPSGDSWPLAEKWLDAWERDPTHDTLSHARAEFDAWKKRQAPAVDNDTCEDDWILEDGEGYAAEQVARKFNTTPSRVRALRVRNEREMQFGQRIRGARPAPRLHELVERGLAARQISMLTGVKRSTAQDAINRHRKAA